MKKNLLIVVIVLCGIFFALSRLLVIRKPVVDRENIISEINRHDYYTLAVSVVGQEDVRLSVQNKESVDEFCDLIEVREDVGAVMSAGTYRFVLSKADQSTESFQLVLGQFLRHEGGSDFKLTDQSSQAIKQWLVTHGIAINSDSLQQRQP